MANAPLLWQSWPSTFHEGPEGEVWSEIHELTPRSLFRMPRASDVTLAWHQAVLLCIKAVLLWFFGPLSLLLLLLLPVLLCYALARWIYECPGKALHELRHAIGIVRWVSSILSLGLPYSGFVNPQALHARASIRALAYPRLQRSTVHFLDTPRTDCGSRP